MIEERIFNFVYQTKNIITSKTYIGVHSCNNLDDGYLGSGKALRESIKKYGKENFKREILCFFDTAEEAYEEEAWLVDKEWVKSPDNYNLVLGGQRPYNNLYKGEKHFNYGRKKSKEQLAKFSKAMKGRLAGKNNPAYKGTVYAMCGMCPMGRCESSSDAGNKMKITSGSVRSCIVKERETTNGFRFTRDIRKEQEYVRENGISRHELQERVFSKNKQVKYKGVYQYCAKTREFIAHYENNVEASNRTGINIYYINKVLSGKSYSGITKGFIFSLTKI